MVRIQVNYDTEENRIKTIRAIKCIAVIKKVSKVYEGKRFYIDIEKYI
jgi:hypothetical protein